VKKDVAIVRLSQQEELIIATDNSGSIGMKQADDVNVPYDVVTYYNFRVAYMECVAAGATPLSVIVHNFSGDDAWAQFVRGIKRGMQELGISLEITGSTESNFTLNQSAVGLVIIGKRPIRISHPMTYNDQLEVAVIGKPLVGDEVIDHPEGIAPLQLFQKLADHPDVVTIQTVGSKGILSELQQLFSTKTLTFSSTIDFIKSSGPATCFIIVYEKTLSTHIQNIAGHLLHHVHVSESMNDK